MKTAFYAGASGLVAYQQALDNTGNNLANVNTEGYKPQLTSFDDLVYTQMWVNNNPKPENGNGVRITSNGLQMTQSPVTPMTGDGYNYAINNSKDGQFGLFAVEDNDGNIYYTRNGAFTVDVDAGELVTQDGKYVLDDSGSHIPVDVDPTDDDDEDEEDETPLTQQIGVYTFANPSALNASSDTLYQQTEQSGEATALDPEEGGYSLLHGYLEQSGVSVQDEMANLILAQRAYQLSARVVQTSDEMEQVINALRG